MYEFQTFTQPIPATLLHEYLFAENE